MIIYIQIYITNTYQQLELTNSRLNNTKYYFQKRHELSLIFKMIIVARSFVQKYILNYDIQ